MTGRIVVLRTARALLGWLACALVGAPSCQVVSGLAEYEVPARAIGESCGVDPECTSGHCADGFCCDVACSGACETCGAEGSEGQCTPHPLSSDPDGDCGQLGHCDGQGFCVAGTHLWSKQYGDSAVQGVGGLVLDDDDGIVLVGTFSGTIDFGGGPLTAAGYSEREGNDVFVAKLGADGGHLWSKQFGDSDVQQATSVAVDAAGDVIVAGTYRGSIDLGTGEVWQGGSKDSVFVAKLDAGGNARWSYGFSATFPGREQDSRLGPPYVAVGEDDTVLLYGHYRGLIDLGGGVLSSIGDEDVYLAKLTAGGDFVWHQGFGYQDTAPTAERPWALRVSADAEGNPIIVGTYRYGISIGNQTLSQDGDPPTEQAFVAKLGREQGAPLWCQSISGVGPQMVNQFAVDEADDSIVVVGVFGDQLRVADQVLFAGEDQLDLFVLRLTGDGQLERLQRFPGSTGTIGQLWNAPNDVDIGPHGNVALFGMVAGSVNFGPSTVHSAGLLDVLVAKLSPELSHVLSKRYGDQDVQMAGFGAVDQQGNMVVSGGFEGRLDFGGPTALESHGADIFLVKFSP